MSGKVGVAYRLFNQQYFGLALQPRNVFNDYAMLRHKCSEFIYQAIIADVDCLALRKSSWVYLFKMPFFKKNYSKAWCAHYLQEIKRPVNEHRMQMCDLFRTRVDYVEMSAFGVDFKQQKMDYGGFDNFTV